jgi:hypothetical protein
MQSALDNSVVETLKTVPDVIDVIPVLELSGQGKFGDIVTLDVNTVSSSATLLKSEGVKITYGRLFTADEPNKVVITKAVSQVFGTAPEEMLGQTVSLTLFQNDATGQVSRKDSFSPQDNLH